MTTLSEIVLEAVAQYKGVQAADLDEPLHHSINPEALDTLFRDTYGEVTFEYLDLLVTVTSNEDVRVRVAGQ